MKPLAEIASLRWMSEGQFWCVLFALIFCGLAIAYCSPPPPVHSQVLQTVVRG